MRCFDVKSGLVFLCMICMFGCTSSAQHTFSSKMVWDKAPHNAFTSLITYNDELYLAFREGKAHVDRNGRDNGIIRILKSGDGEAWHSYGEIRMDGYDLRDPQLSLFSEGVLTLSFAAATYMNGRPKSYSTCITKLIDGRFEKPYMVSAPLSHHWLWRIHWYEGKAYGFNYINSFDLLTSNDGKSFSLEKKFSLSGRPTETDFLICGEEVTVVAKREHETALIGKGKLQNGDIRWEETDIQLAAPMLFQVNPELTLLLATVFITPQKREPRLYKVNGTTLQHVGTFPANADCGYMGAAVFKDKLFVSYYSTVSQGKTAIYVSMIPLNVIGG